MGIWGDAYGPSSQTQHAINFLQEASLPTTFSRGTIQNAAWNVHFPRAQDHPLFYVGVYTLISFAIGIVTILSLVTQYVGSLRASRILFKRLLIAVVRATMRWHVSLIYLGTVAYLMLFVQDTTPQGRMLNRFGKV